MEHGLPAICAVICDQSVARGIDALLFCKGPRNRDEMPHQRLIRFLERGNRLDVTVRHDQNVRRRDRVDVAESGGLLIAVHDGSGDFT